MYYFKITHVTRCSSLFAAQNFPVSVGS